MSTPNEYREALKGILECYERSDWDFMPTAMAAAKALLAQPEPKPSDELNRLRQMIHKYRDAAIDHNAELTVARGEVLTAAITLLCIEITQLRALRVEPAAAEKPIYVKLGKPTPLPARKFPDDADDAAEKARELFTRDEWTEEDGDVMWWHFPISEVPYVGRLDGDDIVGHECEDYYTHWTRIPLPSPPDAPGDEK